MRLAIAAAAAFAMASATCAADVDVRLAKGAPDTWEIRSGGKEVATVAGYMPALDAAIAALTPGRTAAETVHVWDDGLSGDHEWDGDLRTVDVPSHTVLDFHGTTFRVNDSVGADDVVPLRIRDAKDVTVRNLRITGNPRYGIRVEAGDDVTLSQIHLSLREATSIGLGIRIEWRKGRWSRNIAIDHVYGEHCATHVVETYGVDGLEIGSVEARETGGCGLLLNATRNARIGRVSAYRATPGGGYAAFRIANDAGPNIAVGEVIARECGRGFFSVNGSRGCTIDRVDIEGCTSHGILLENAQDITIRGGTIRNCGSEGVRISSRREFHRSERNTVEGLAITGCARGIRETGPSDGNTFRGNRLSGNGTCLELEGAATVAADNECDE